ncbi:hypothetical protein EB796_012880 [Bugula neritina]|uniref:Uncharacterized protein n=1 Tax=Bugula neritina TaxID=10212 RepID=A0A7J7JT32_BUGNE|nr:hypothetical protein EB796_012880 [Bugula neritina]
MIATPEKYTNNQDLLFVISLFYSNSFTAFDALKPLFSQPLIGFLSGWLKSGFNASNAAYNLTKKFVHHFIYSAKILLKDSVIGQ